MERGVSARELEEATPVEGDVTSRWLGIGEDSLCAVSVERGTRLSAEEVSKVGRVRLAAAESTLRVATALRSVEGVASAISPGAAAETARGESVDWEEADSGALAAAGVDWASARATSVSRAVRSLVALALGASPGSGMTSTFRATRVSGSFTSRRLSNDELSLNRTDWAEAGPDSAMVSALRALAVSGTEVVAAESLVEGMGMLGVGSLATSFVSAVGSS